MNRRPPCAPDRKPSHRRGRALALLAAGLLALLGGDRSAPAEEAPTDLTKEAARAAFFEGLDLQQAGDLEGAVARFELALGDDPELHQARLYLAECFHGLGLDDRAREQLEIYVATDFPGADHARAAELMTEYGGDPDSVVPPTEHAGEGEGGDDEPPVRRAAAGRWQVLSLGAGASVAHWANEIGLVAVGPTLELRWLPLTYLEIGLRGGIAFGPHPTGTSAVRVPEVAAEVAASIPLGKVRLLAGAGVPVTFSRLPRGPRADVGIRGVLGVRVGLGTTPLYAAVVAEGGYLVAPTVGGSLRLGVQLGPERN